MVRFKVRKSSVKTAQSGRVASPDVSAQPLNVHNQPSRSMGLWIAILTFAMVASTTFVAVPEAEALPSGVTFGASAMATNGNTHIEEFEALEALLGQKLPLIRTFGHWDDNYFNDRPVHRWARDGDRQLMVSIKPTNSGTIIPWADIAAARSGSPLYNDIAAFADSAKAYGENVIVTMHHEPEATHNLKFGTSADYTAAFRRFVEIFREEGADNVSFAIVMTSFAHNVTERRPDDRRQPDLWYPGDDVIDFIGVDSYNWAGCDGGDPTWESLEENLERFLEFSDRHPSKKLILGEWGSDEGAPGQKGAWLDEASAFLKSDRADRLAAVMYFHTNAGFEGRPDCTWRLDTSQASIDAARRMLADPFFQAPVPLGNSVTPPPTTPPTTAPTTTVAPTTVAPTTVAPTTVAPTTVAPTTVAPTTVAPTTVAPTTVAPPVMCQGLEATLVGTSGDDVLVGTSGIDVIVGLSGDDIIRGLEGNDLVCAGGGNDKVFGGPGDDIIQGGAHNDRLFGGNGKDIVRGGLGSDFLSGGNGADRLRGGNGADVLEGGAHADVLSGENGADTIRGDAGNDILRGGNGNDNLRGGNGADVLEGGAHADVLSGQNGNDTIRGNGGHDTLRGGNGNDSLSGGNGHDSLSGGTGNNQCNGDGGRNFLNPACR